MGNHNVINNAEVISVGVKSNPLFLFVWVYGELFFFAIHKLSLVPKIIYHFLSW